MGLPPIAVFFVCIACMGINHLSNGNCKFFTLCTYSLYSLSAYSSLIGFAELITAYWGAI